MNTLLKTPPPLPSAYQEKVRGYATARRSFLAKGAVRRTLAIVLAVALAAIVAEEEF